MKSANLSLNSIKPAVATVVRAFRRYSGVLIFLFFMGIYGYMVVRINTLSNPVVTKDEIIGEVKALPTPRMDEEAAAKLQALEDNSVNVQTLFDQGRKSPFNE